MFGLKNRRIYEATKEIEDNMEGGNRMTNYKLHNILLHIANKTYPGSYIAPFYVELEKKELLTKNGDYDERDCTIKIYNLSRSESSIVLTALHLFAHHIQYDSEKTVEHNSNFYIILKDLLTSAVLLGYVNYEKIRTLKEETVIKVMEQKAGRVRAKYNPVLDVNKNYCTISVRNSYPLRNLLKEKGYTYSALERLWEKDMTFEEAKKEETLLKEKYENVLITVKKLTDLSIDAIYNICIRGSTYPIKDTLTEHGYYYKDKTWNKTIPAKEKNNELMFLKQFNNIQYKITD